MPTYSIRPDVHIDDFRVYEQVSKRLPPPYSADSFSHAMAALLTINFSAVAPLLTRRGDKVTFELADDNGATAAWLSVGRKGAQVECLLFSRLPFSKLLEQTGFSFASDRPYAFLGRYHPGSGQFEMTREFFAAFNAATDHLWAAGKQTAMPSYSVDLKLFSTDLNPIRVERWESHQYPQLSEGLLHLLGPKVLPLDQTRFREENDFKLRSAWLTELSKNKVVAALERPLPQTLHLKLQDLDLRQLELAAGIDLSAMVAYHPKATYLVLVSPTDPAGGLENTLTQFQKQVAEGKLVTSATPHTNWQYRASQTVRTQMFAGPDSETQWNYYSPSAQQALLRTITAIFGISMHRLDTSQPIATLTDRNGQQLAAVDVAYLKAEGNFTREARLTMHLQPGLAKIVSAKGLVKGRMELANFEQGTLMLSAESFGLLSNLMQYCRVENQLSASPHIFEPDTHIGGRYTLLVREKSRSNGDPDLMPASILRELSYDDIGSAFRNLMANDRLFHPTAGEQRRLTITTDIALYRTHQTEPLALRTAGVPLKGERIYSELLVNYAALTSTEQQQLRNKQFLQRGTDFNIVSRRVDKIEFPSKDRSVRQPVKRSKGNENKRSNGL